MRARMALLAGGHAVELREVVLRDKPDALLAASPKGTVPVLVFEDGRVLEESLDIMRFALRGHSWMTSEAADQVWIDRNDGPFKHDLDRAKYGTRYPDCDPLEHRARGEAFLHDLDSVLARGHLSADGLGFADYAIAPFVRQFANHDAKWFATLELAHLKPWLTGILDGALFQAAMVRVPPWTPGQAPVTFGGRTDSRGRSPR